MTRWLGRIEDGIYLVVGGALSIAAAVLVLWAGWEFVQSAMEGVVSEAILRMLDRLLLVLMLVEIMHTVRISVGKKVLVIEPFLVVGLIAAVRRILIVTAEQANPTAEHAVEFQMAMLELGILTFMILALVGAIYGVRKMSRQQSGTSQPDEAAGETQAPLSEGQPVHSSSGQSG